MSLRDQFKKGFGEFKGDIKQLFCHKGIPTPTTPSSEQSQVNASEMNRRLPNLEAGTAGTPSAISMPATPLVNPQPSWASCTNTSLGQPVPPIHSIEWNRSGAEGPNQGKLPADAGVEAPTHQHSPTDESTVMNRPSNINKCNQANFTNGSIPQASYNLSNMRKGLKELWRVLEPVTGLFGPVKELVVVIEGCTAGAAKVEYDGMRVRLEATIEDLLWYSEGGLSLTMTPSMESICGSIQAELDRIRTMLEKNCVIRYLEGSDQADTIIRCYQRIELDLQRLTVNANWETMKDVKEQAASSRIDRLSPSLSARYNSAEADDELKRQACTPGTRVKVLDDIFDWACNGEDGSVYWLNGMAGTGKTTIAYSLCDKLQVKHKLAASFFCSRLREECRKVKRIIPSIAYQLARFSLPFLSVLSTTLQKDLDIHSSSLSVQFDELVAKPLRAVRETLPKGLVIVIDALDECESKESTGKFLGILLNGAIDLPVRFLVSSRPEAQIRGRMTDERVKSRLVLHELEKGEVQEDIETYLRMGLAPMKPSEEDIAKLVARAGILFIYAATVVRYIGYNDFSRNPDSRLRTILDASKVTTARNKEIDQLYGTVLGAALGDPELDDCERDDMQRVLHTVICAREPLTVKGLSQLLNINNVDRVRAALRPMWSVLHIVTGSELVTTLHASFPDFMFDSARSETYYCDSNAQQHKLAENCLDYIAKMHSQLNICGLESPYLPDEKVPDIEKRMANAIPSELLYACRYWADHVNAGQCASSVGERIRDFLSTRLLLWMEILNLSHHMKSGIDCTRLAVEWCKNIEGEQQLAELAFDARRFVEAFSSNAVSESTPHIYVSMLTFWPKSAPVSKHYAKYTRGPIDIEGPALDRRQLAHLSTWGFDKTIKTLAVSPDRQHIALALENDVWGVDWCSGQVVLGPLQGHTNDVKAVGFSPDGARILAGSFGYPDKRATILGWSTRSGDTVLGPLQLRGHNDDINCLSFSPDCCSLVTGSDDRTVRLWDAQTGELLLCLEAQGWVQVAVFSRDGTRVVAGFGDALQVWGSQAGDTIFGPINVTNLDSVNLIATSPDNSGLICADIDGKTIQGGEIQGDGITFRQIAKHPSDVSCIAYSPNGKQVVSGSYDRTVHVWDTQTGGLVLGPLEAHTDVVRSVIFSSDGSHIMSTCNDGLVCTWDAQHRSLTPVSAHIPSSRITCVKFSSDGSQFASGSEEGEICIWDVETGDIAIGPVNAHTGQINAIDFKNERVAAGFEAGQICVCDARSGKIVLGALKVGSRTIQAIAYSPDGNLIATGSFSGVDVWNAQDGSRVIGSLTDIRGHVRSIQFSPDGTQIVASSSNESSNIVVWNLSDGRNVFGTLDGHNNWVCSVAFSPNGTLIASCSADQTIILWDAYTGRKAIGPLTGHSDWVRSVSFSPDSTRLVSGSSDKTIRIWDVKTGEVLFELLHGHEHSILSVEYSPDGTRILSCSFDMSARVHDARSPEERARSRSVSEFGDWTMKKDGWVVDDQSRLLVWVPGDLRKGLMWPRTQVVVPQGYTRLKFDKNRMDESWARSFVSDM